MVKRILLISNFGPLYTAEALYKYLMRIGIEVYTVGRIWPLSYPPFDEHYKRCDKNHLNVKFDWKIRRVEGKIEKVRFDLDLASIFDFYPGDFDAIIECETQQLQIKDNTKIIKRENIPYYYYKTEVLIDYVNPIATHYFYSSELVKDKLIKLIEKPDLSKMEWLPFTFDPELIPKDKCEIEYPLFFAGGIPPEQAEKKFHEIYKSRIEIINPLKELLDGQFQVISHRKYNYFEYLKELQKAKILFNVGVGCANYRDFEAMALGKPLLTLWNSEYRSLHLRPVHDFYTFNNLKSAYLMARDLLKRSPQDLKRIGNNAKQVFYQYHQPIYRAEKIKKVIYNE